MDWVRIIRVPFLIPFNAVAQTWGNVILLRWGAVPTVRLIAHELVHVVHWGLEGLMFPVNYVGSWIRNRFDNRKNFYEKEAHKMEDYPEFRDAAREVLRRYE